MSFSLSLLPLSYKIPYACSPTPIPPSPISCPDSNIAPFQLILHNPSWDWCCFSLKKKKFLKTEIQSYCPLQHLQSSPSPQSNFQISNGGCNVFQDLAPVHFLHLIFSHSLTVQSKLTSTTLTYPCLPQHHALSSLCFPLCPEHFFLPFITPIWSLNAFPLQLNFHAISYIPWYPVPSHLTFFPS